MNSPQESIFTASQPQPSPCSKQIDEFCTPKSFRHKRLNVLVNQESRSPALQIPASPMMKRLGYGSGVGVYLLERSPMRTGELRSPWAIKKIMDNKVRETKELCSKRLELEAEVLRCLSHPNIIGYRAFGNPNDDITFLAMEKASTSLGDLIEERFDELSPSPMDLSPFPAKNMEKVAVDVAKALVYLHDEKKLIHGDLKSFNVLIFGDFEIAKLCDFGVCRKINEDGTIDGRYVGTEIWNPSEVLLLNRGLKKSAITSKADIYPYGLTLHEMMTLKPPHFNTAEETYIKSNSNDSMEDDLNTNESASVDDFDEAAFDATLSKHLGKRPALPDVDFDESYNTILGVFYCCTEEDPEKRPTAKQILLMLESNASATNVNV